MTTTSLSDTSMMQRAQQSNQSANGGNSVSVEDLFAQYGAENVEQAVSNFVAEYLKEAMSSMIDQMALPQFQQDLAMQALGTAIEEFMGQVPDGADQGVQQYAGDDSQSSNFANAALDGIMSLLQQNMQDETSAASKGAGGVGGGAGNWLALLARALGKVAGEHLQKMVELGEKMGQLDSKEQASEFAKTQAEFQAESQIFKMFQEAIGTMIKSIGEGMSSVARKQ